MISDLVKAKVQEKAQEVQKKISDSLVNNLKVIVFNVLPINVPKN
jgi:hypothetical protein